MMRFTTKLLPSRSSNVGLVQLNNPKTFHALDLEMVRALTDVLPVWQSDSSVKATVFSGSSQSKKKSFCAGGDVKSIYLAGIGGERTVDDEHKHTADTHQHGFGQKKTYTADMFREEYQLNYLIATQKGTLPQISLWDGIVMGGGVGISIHGKYRVATENTLFAMPETSIGFFPDVGSTYWLPRLSGGLGNYIALTGARLKANDLLYAGIATHYVPSERLNDLVQAVVDVSKHGNEGDDDSEQGTDIAAGLLMSFHEDIGKEPSFLAQFREEIDEAFAMKNTVEEIMAALENSKSKFGSSTLSTLQKMSPTSLKVTLDGIRRGKMCSNLGECLKMEFRMSQRFMRRDSDFYEGVRALLIDKDHSPKWEPEVLES
mmetsp:Transcript_12547/g.14718  ORF Transcript_12547/g.14718 Transcript_12547/m.14718 type:complete len:374 (-) Transcript_12547:264-1385(-)